MQAKIPLISMAQMSRKIEERGPAAVPLSSDMRDSGILEQAAELFCLSVSRERRIRGRNRGRGRSSSPK